MPIENDIAIDMAANIAARQTSLITMGWQPNGAKYAINGMFNVAKNTVTAGGHISAKFGNFATGVSSAIATLKKNGVYSGL